jgi:F0F1-type ATP synthase assembly protein I
VKTGLEHGQEMAANVIVGLALGWGAEKLWPSIKPWGMACGLILGTVSGFYQLFKLESLRKKKPPEPKP